MVFFMKQHPQDLNERERQILHAVVHSYITTAEPVGSRTVVKRFDLGVSAATVRNVMADLEDLGYLQQLHTSSGRVPTDQGYRYYVDYLMHVQQLTLSERQRIEKEFMARVDDADSLLRQTSHLLALISHQAGLAETPAEGSALTQRIELLSLAPERLAVLILDNLGRLRTYTAYMETPLRSDDITSLTRFLNDNLHGAPVERLSASLEARLREFMDDRRRLADQALQVLRMLPLERTTQLYMEGANQLFEQPEFRDIAKARQVFGLLDAQDRIISLIRSAAEAEGTHPRNSILIGIEGKIQGLEDISVIAAPYKVNDETVGMIGVLGPRRMPYSRLTAIVDYTAKFVSRVLTQMVGPKK